MKHFVIDGYNLLFAFAVKDDEIEISRKEMISFLFKQLQTSKDEFTFIFDSSPNNAWEFEYRAPFKIIFAPPQLSADQYILEIVQGNRYPHDLTVITSDKMLAHECRSLGASTQSCSAFLKFSLKKNKIEEEKPKATKKERDRWLKIFEKKRKEE